MSWKLKYLSKLNKPVFIEGLPGVGKVAIDFLIEKVNAKQIA